MSNYGSGTYGTGTYDSSQGNRLTQVAFEVLTQGNARVRITQVAVEMVIKLFPKNSIGVVVSLPIFPVQYPGVILTGNLVRSASWNIVESPFFATEQPQAKSGRRVRIPDWKNPIYEWTFTFNYMKANPADILGQNSGYTDFDIMKGFYLAASGAGRDFAFIPKDGYQIGPLISPPAAPTLSQTAGGALSGTTYYVKITYLNGPYETTPSGEHSLAVSANNLLVVTSPASGTGITGYNVYVSTTSGAEVKQNGTAINIGTNWTEPTGGLVGGSAPPTTNAASTRGAQTLAAPDVNGYTELTMDRGGQFSESVQELNGGVPSVFVNGVGKTQGVDYNVLNPASVPGYSGYVLQWLISPGVNPITVNYSPYFYRCQFAEDNLDFEQFMFYLYEMKKMVIRQVRL